MEGLFLEMDTMVTFNKNKVLLPYIFTFLCYAGLININFLHISVLATNDQNNLTPTNIAYILLTGFISGVGFYSAGYLKDVASWKMRQPTDAEVNFLNQELDIAKTQVKAAETRLAAFPSEQQLKLMSINEKMKEIDVLKLKRQEANLQQSAILNEKINTSYIIADSYKKCLEDMPHNKEACGLYKELFLAAHKDLQLNLAHQNQTQDNPVKVTV